VESWSEGETILGNANPTVRQRLQPSFNVLKPHLKECFMDMGSFLQDQKIRASLIIDIWMELYGRGSSSTNKFMLYLNELASQNLLKLVHLGYVGVVFYNICFIAPSCHLPFDHELICFTYYQDK